MIHFRALAGIIFEDTYQRELSRRSGIVIILQVVIQTDLQLAVVAPKDCTENTYIPIKASSSCFVGACEKFTGLYITSISSVLVYQAR